MRVMVTGAARGIGLQVANACLARGYSVVACDFDTSGLEQHFSQNEQVSTYCFDVRNAEAWDSTVDAAWAEAPIDTLVNVAGVLRAGNTGELIPAEVEQQIGVNVVGVILGTNKVAALMKQRGSGHIVNVGSTACLFPTPGNGVYSASKHAVRGFTIAAAGDLRASGIHLSLVCPTAVKTDMLEQQRGDERAALTFEGKRALAPAEVAETIVADVMVNKPLECFLPPGDRWKGLLCAAFPEFFLSNVEKARAKGVENFNSDAY